MLDMREVVEWRELKEWADDLVEVYEAAEGRVDLVETLPGIFRQEPTCADICGTRIESRHTASEGDCGNHLNKLLLPDRDVNTLTQYWASRYASTFSPFSYR